MNEVKMPYSVYKKQYSQYKKLYGSYNKVDRTIIVKLPDGVEYTPTEQTESEWLSVNVNTNNIKCWSNAFACIKLPYQSEYRNCEMWVTKKLIKKVGGMYQITFREDFSFRIRKKSGCETEILGGDLIEIFGADQEYPLLHIPDKLEPIKQEALEELKDAD